jgi:hypothetical protein
VIRMALSVSSSLVERAQRRIAISRRSTHRLLAAASCVALCSACGSDTQLVSASPNAGGAAVGSGGTSSSGGNAGTMSASGGSSGSSNGGSAGAGGGGQSGSGGASVDAGMGASGGSTGGTAGAGGGGAANCPNGGWGCPELIAQYIVAPNDPDLAVDRNGNAFAVWATYDAGAISIWASRFDAQTSKWEAPHVLENEPTPSSDAPKVAVDGGGNAFAVWLHNGNVWGSRYDAATRTWSSAGAIETHGTQNNFVAKPHIAAGADGIAFAAWQQDDTSTRTHIWACRYDKAQGKFGPSERIDDVAATADAPHLAVDGNGNAIAIFGQRFALGDLRWHAHANRYDAATGTWGTPGGIDAAATQGNAVSLRVSTNATGAATAIWWQQTGSGDRIWANRFDASTGWATAEPIGNPGTYLEQPHVAMDGNGNAFTIWYGDDHAWTVRYDAGARRWAGAKRLDAGAGWVLGWTDVVADNTGAYAVWTQTAAQALDSPPTFMASHHAAGASDWAGAVPISATVFLSGTFKNYGAPRIGTDGNGHAVAVWWQYDSVNFNLWGNRSQ